jgi:hypothetical protein
MIEGIRYIPAGQLQLLEIATGPDVRDFGLWQSGDHLVTLVNEYDIYDKTLFVEVHASEATRFRRNQQRDDFVSEEIMRVAACAGGELFHVADVLGDHYWQINNEADGEIYHLADQAYTNFIRPHLYTDHNTIEYGSAQARERHDR